MKYDIRLNVLTLSWFRGFEHNTTIDFDKNLTILISENGGGKTTVLEAISYFLFELRAMMTGDLLKPPYRIHGGIKSTKRPNNDVNINSPTNSYVNRLGIDFKKEFGKEENYQSFGLNFRGTATGNTPFQIDHYGGNDSTLEDFLLSIKEIIDTNNKLNGIPLLAYYDCGAVKTNVSYPTEAADLRVLEGLTYSLERYDSSFTKFYYLVDTLQKVEFQNNHTFPILKTITDAVSFMLNEEDDSTYGKIRIKWSTEGDEMQLLKDGQYISLFHLSSGEKALLALVADIARRLYICNQNMENPLSGYGVILIDEIDLHLHPKWQQKVVTKLRTLFPNVQFIVTTHSPLVLSNVYSKHIRSIENGKIYGVTDTFGHDDADDMLRVMGFKSKTQEKLRKIHALLRKNKLQEAKEIRATLETEGTFAPLLEIDSFIRRKERQLNEIH